MLFLEMFKILEIVPFCVMFKVQIKIKYFCGRNEMLVLMA